MTKEGSMLAAMDSTESWAFSTTLHGFIPLGSGASHDARRSPQESSTVSCCPGKEQCLPLEEDPVGSLASMMGRITPSQCACARTLQWSASLLVAPTLSCWTIRGRFGRSATTSTAAWASDMCRIGTSLSRYPARAGQTPSASCMRQGLCQDLQRSAQGSITPCCSTVQGVFSPLELRNLASWAWATHLRGSCLLRSWGCRRPFLFLPGITTA
mmetsp:Transcript_11717/g.28670  ORF Transcript_11717/g.28670 Transcript_11717/m.28670 type:complete len:213 (-) Transcript_11717:699-1337(-)